MGTDIHGHCEVRTEHGWLLTRAESFVSGYDEKQEDELLVGYLPATTAEGAWLPQPGVMFGPIVGDYDTETWTYRTSHEGRRVELDESIDRNRNYALFAALARMRLWRWSDGKPDVLTAFGFPEAKGFPEDAHELTRRDYASDGADAHTPTWLTIAEMKQIVLQLRARELRELALAEDGTDYSELEEWANAGAYSLEAWANALWADALKITAHARANGFELTPNDVRVVVWFDN